jgi:hypothetical protein
MRLGAAAGTPANTYFNGEMSEVRLWSTAQTQSAIQANMGINLVGSETNLIGLWEGNGAATDTTANANNLTLTNGAVDNTVDNPYNLTEYANIIAVSYSNPTSTITLNTGDYGTIPNMTLSTPLYSNVFMPQGFPVGLRDISVKRTILGTNFAPGTTALTDINGLSHTLTVPVGATHVEFLTNLNMYNTGGADNMTIQLREGSTTLDTYKYRTAALNSPEEVSGYTRIVATPGSHTYKLSMSGGTSNPVIEASTTELAAFTVKVG